MAHLSRRNFLNLLYQGSLAFSGLLGLSTLVKFLSFKPDPPPPTRYEVGSIENYPLDVPTVISAVPAILIRTRDETRVISLVCTHLGCTAEVQGMGLGCLCHGSQYNLEGIVERGPASLPLPVLRTELTKDGTLVIYKDA